MGIKNGVAYYTGAELTMSIHFPEDNICCEYCPLCVKDPDNYGRFICFDTREILVYPKVTVGTNCKIRIKAVQKDEQTEAVAGRRNRSQSEKGDGKRGDSAAL